MSIDEILDEILGGRLTGLDQKFIIHEEDSPILIAILRSKIFQFQNELGKARQILEDLPENRLPFALQFGLYVTQAYISLSHDDIAMVDHYSEKAVIYRDILDEHKDLGNSKWAKMWKGYLLHLQGIFFWRTGNDLVSIESYHQSISYNKDLQNLIPLSRSYNNLANVYKQQGYLDQALQNYEASYQINVQLDIQQYISNNLMNIGDTYRRLDDYDKALDYLLRSLAILREIRNENTTMFCLAFLLQTYLELQRTEEARAIQVEIETLYHNNSETLIFELLYKYSKGLLLKISRGFNDHVQAQLLFEEVITKNNFLHELNVVVNIHLSELLLAEYKLEYNDEILFELENVIDKLKAIAEMQGSKTLLIETGLLESQISLLKGRFYAGLNQFDEALLLAEKYNLKFLRKKIELKRVKYLDELQKWQIMLNQDPQLRKKLTSNEIRQYLDELSNIL